MPVARRIGIARGWYPHVGCRRLWFDPMSRELRQHRRLELRLPIECQRLNTGEDRALRSTTRNISSGGVYFEAELADGIAPPELASLLSVELTVPPGEGYFPYEGRVSGVAEVLRCEPLTSSSSAATANRVGVAARFREPLKLAF